ncbi:ABC transporter ATP-binding protein [Paenibacillus tritici]|uniref:ABC transporter ATP-binding protein n=1 Tax=Paenibacillus tritici TaxID=1873425 RepID=UPI001BAADC7D|nr:ABC transporter ATP-binding protein [Paenibacillus tritici]QUL57849.1 ABC transporter ATP-binding protein [Paenibacillus tritici]
MFTKVKYIIHLFTYLCTFKKQGVMKLQLLRYCLDPIKIMIKFCKAHALLKIILLIVSAILAPLSLLLTEDLIDSVSELYKGNAGYTHVSLNLVLLLITILTISLCTSMEGYLNINFDRLLLKNWTPVVLNKYKQLKYSCFEDQETQDTIFQMSDNPSESIKNSFLNITQIGSSLLSLVLLNLVFAKVSVWLSVLCFLFTVPMLFLNYRAMTILDSLFYKQSAEDRKLGYLLGLLTTKSSLSELKLFGAVEYIVNQWGGIRSKVYKERVGANVTSQKLIFINTLCVMAWTVLVIITLVNYMYNGLITLGLFVALMGSLNSIISISEQVSWEYSEYSRNVLKTKYYKRFMSLPESEESADLKRERCFNSPEICFNDVYFSYPQSQKPILQGVSLTIRPNERIAIVGKNGAGKSTLIKLLCGLYQPDRGEITINGIALSNLSQHEISALFSVVFQDFMKYSLTVRENIALGNITKIHNDAAIDKALGQAEPMGFLKLTGKGLNTPLGKLEEDGIDLSGGEWQRITIARALFADSSFIILDEPTASLDPVAESELYQSLSLVIQEKGSIMISHRLASAKLADKIFVIDDGRICEEGNHDELIAKQGIYAEMFRAQAKWYDIIC